MERHISSLREVRRGCDEGEEGKSLYLWGRAGEGMEMVVAGSGTIWGGKREDRGSQCVVW